MCLINISTCDSLKPKKLFYAIAMLLSLEYSIGKESNKLNRNLHYLNLIFHNSDWRTKLDSYMSEIKQLILNKISEYSITYS